MKVEISKDPDTREPYGVRLTADTPEEDAIFERFWRGGVKINSRGHETLQFTFKDLIEIEHACKPKFFVTLCRKCHTKLQRRDES